MPGNQNGNEKSMGQQLLELSGAGLQLTATIGGAALVGWLLDERLGTKPWLLLTLILLGAAGGVFALIRTVRKVSGDSGKDQAGPG